MSRRTRANRAIAGAGALIFAMSVLDPQEGWCQSTGAFDELSTRLRADDRVVVALAGERPVRGRVVSISETAFRVAAGGSVREFTAAQIERIDRVTPDGLKNGTLWGLVAGFGASFLALPLAASHIRLDDADSALVVALFVVPAAGAAAGAAIDASITTDVPVYVRHRITLSVSVGAADRARAASLGLRLAF